MLILDDVDLDTDSVKPTAPKQYMCTQCHKLRSLGVQCACGCASSVPYLDRRPLLLSDEALCATQALIDTIAERINDDDCLIDEQLSYSGDLLPFVIRMIDESFLAATRKSEGNLGFRTTTISTENIIGHIRELRIPPSA